MVMSFGFTSPSWKLLRSKNRRSTVSSVSSILGSPAYSRKFLFLQDHVFELLSDRTFFPLVKTISLPVSLGSPFVAVHTVMKMRRLPNRLLGELFLLLNQLDSLSSMYYPGHDKFLFFSVARYPRLSTLVKYFSQTHGDCNSIAILPYFLPFS